MYIGLAKISRVHSPIRCADNLLQTEILSYRLQINLDRMKAAKEVMTLVLFAVSATAAPLLTTANKPSLGLIFSRESVNDCGDSSFTNQSSPGSPLVDDCMTITTNIADGGLWTVIAPGSRQLVQYGTCAFGVSVNSGRTHSISIGKAWSARRVL
jgi:hypothetical protein